MWRPRPRRRLFPLRGCELFRSRCTTVISLMFLNRSTATCIRSSWRKSGNGSVTCAVSIYLPQLGKLKNGIYDDELGVALTIIVGVLHGLMFETVGNFERLCNL